MGCLSCCKPRRWRNEVSIDDDNIIPTRSNFAFRDLAIATQNFGSTNLIGEGGFGKVFKGQIKIGQSEQTVAIKLLDQDRGQGNQEFLTEVLMLSLLDHWNLVNLIGYCIDGDQRVLVYEFMPKGSLDNHLFDLNKRPLEWNTRIKIALGAARGLEYLHCTANPPVIHRDMKSANVLLDAEFNPRLSDFGLAKLGPVGGKSHVTTRVLGSRGYCAPDYDRSGKLTFKSDVYSFGVVLLELITGRRAYDTTKKQEERYLINWAHHFFKDRRKFGLLVDPRLQGHFSKHCLESVIAITARCLQEEPRFRPSISDVLVSLEHLAAQPYNSEAHHTRGDRSTPSSSPSQWGAPVLSPIRY